jgi:hypothetical protein
MAPSSTDILPRLAEKSVSVARCARILGVCWTTVRRLAVGVGTCGKPVITLIESRRFARKRILYSSIVYFCDHLRQRYEIADRRPKITNPLLRNRDEDLLPFPLADTIYSEEAMSALGYSSYPSLLALIEEGHFEAYRLVRNNPWRISRSSLAAFIENAQKKPSETMEPYKRVARPRMAQLISA